MELIKLSLSSVPLSSVYKADNDLVFDSFKDKTEEGITFFIEKCFKNISDRKINNYSSLYLLNNQTVDNFLKLKTIDQNTSNETFNTSLVDNDSGLYLTISSSNQNISYTFTEKEQKFIDPVDRIFEINIINSLSATILHKNKNKNTYYLNYSQNGLIFETIPNNNVFNVLLDRENNILSLFKTINDSVSCIIQSNMVLQLTANSNAYKNNYFNINYYKNNIIPKLNTSWVSYKTENVNLYDINDNKSRINLTNNYLLNTEYSYITGDTIESNILTLKNQKTHKNYSHRSNFLEKNNPEMPSVNHRNYIGLFSGNDQELGDHTITLSYEFYNADYAFPVDKYTIFISPETLYPYEQINVNDLNWNHYGSIAGDSPYTSDKIFKNKIKNTKSGGIYLCSWLHKQKDGKSVWLDRYYYPDKTDYAKALASANNYTYTDPVKKLLNTQLTTEELYDVPFVYNSLVEEYENTQQTPKIALFGRSYFDKISDLSIIPNTEYIYHRIGNKYVNQIIKSLEEYILTNKLTLKNGYHSNINIEIIDVDEYEYNFNGDTYSQIENYSDANKMHQFSICFWLKNDNWKNKMGHQLFGNLNDRGFALYDDQKITPFITLQDKKHVHIYNTDFVYLDAVSIENEKDLNNSKIFDLYRTDPLDAIYTINIE